MQMSTVIIYNINFSTKHDKKLNYHKQIVRQR